jgi:hypothetical protein
MTASTLFSPVPPDPRGLRPTVGGEVAGPLEHAVHAVVERHLLAERAHIVIREHGRVERVHALPRRGGRMGSVPEELDVDALDREARPERGGRGGAGTGV